MKEALRARATLGEVSDVLRDEYGEYRPCVLAELAERGQRVADRRESSDADGRVEIHRRPSPPPRADGGEQARDANGDLDDRVDGAQRITEQTSSAAAMRSVPRYVPGTPSRDRGVESAFTPRRRPRDPRGDPPHEGSRSLLAARRCAER